MGFDAAKFAAADWQRRVIEIPVPALKDFFGKDEKPIWKIHSLEGKEVAQAKHAKERNIRVKAAVEKFSEMLSQDPKKIKKTIGDIFGNIESDSDIAWRSELMILASIEPKVDYSTIAQINKYQSETFYLITNKILELIGLGFEPGKLKPSGGTKKSKQH